MPAGHSLQVAFERQGVVQLSSGRIAASRLRPVIMRDNVARAGADAVEGLSHGELLAIDQATMAEVLSAGDGPLVAPFFFETLSNTRGRATLLESFGGRSPRLMIELIGVDGGTPQSRLLETVSLLAPYCGGVIVQAPPGRPCATVIRGVRLSGLSVDCEDAPRSAMSAAARLADCKSHPGVGPLLFAFGLPALAALPLAHKAGATHGSLGAHIVLG